MALGSWSVFQIHPNLLRFLDLAKYGIQSLLPSIVPAELLNRCVLVLRPSRQFRVI